MTAPENSPPTSPGLAVLSTVELQSLLDDTNPAVHDLIDPMHVAACTVAQEALNRLKDSEAAVLRIVAPDGSASHTPIAASVAFEPVFIPPNKVLRHATPAVVLGLSGPAGSWSTRLVLQVLPDVLEADVSYRFARAVQTARLRTP